MAKGSPYQSRLVNVALRLYHQRMTVHRRSVGQLQLTVTWGLQWLLYLADGLGRSVQTIRYPLGRGSAFPPLDAPKAVGENDLPSASVKARIPPPPARPPRYISPPESLGQETPALLPLWQSLDLIWVRTGGMLGLLIPQDSLLQGSPWLRWFGGTWREWLWHYIRAAVDYFWGRTPPRDHDPQLSGAQRLSPQAPLPLVQGPEQEVSSPSPEPFLRGEWSGNLENLVGRGRTLGLFPHSSPASEMVQGFRPDLVVGWSSEAAPQAMAGEGDDPLDIPSVPLGYVPHPLEVVLTGLDRWLLWLEERGMALWRWLCQVWMSLRR